MPQTTSVIGCCGALHAKVWSAAPAARRGVVVVVHGLGEHSGRYDDVAQRLAAAGWSTLAYDQQGHGLSPGRRGCVVSYDALLRDVDAARRTANDLLGDGLQVLLGHSMGANIAANYALHCDRPIDALVLSGPLFWPKHPPSPARLRVGRLIGRLLPFVRIRAPVEAEHLTHDPDDLRRLKSDPLRHRWMSLYLITQLLARGQDALDCADRLRMPMLVLHGDDDPLADPAGSQAFVARNAAQASLRRYPGLLHEIFHEAGREQVFQDLLDWLDQLVRGH